MVRGPSVTRWAELLMMAREMGRDAQRLAETADGYRCAQRESGGMRCTADGLPTHDHRYDEEELPDGEC